MLPGNPRSSAPPRIRSVGLARLHLHHGADEPPAAGAHNQDLCPNFVLSSGQTEMYPATTMSQPDRQLQRLGRVLWLLVSTYCCLLTLGVAAGGLPLSSNPGVLELGEAGAPIAASSSAPVARAQPRLRRRLQRNSSPRPSRPGPALPSRPPPCSSPSSSAPPPGPPSAPAHRFAEAAFSHSFPSPRRCSGPRSRSRSPSPPAADAFPGALLYGAAVLAFTAFRLYQAYRGRRRTCSIPSSATCPAPSTTRRSRSTRGFFSLASRPWGGRPSSPAQPGSPSRRRGGTASSPGRPFAAALLGALLVLATRLSRPLPDGGPALRTAIEGALGGRRDGPIHRLPPLRAEGRRRERIPGGVRVPHRRRGGAPRGDPPAARHRLRLPERRGEAAIRGGRLDRLHQALARRDRGHRPAPAPPDAAPRDSYTRSPPPSPLGPCTCRHAAGSSRRSRSWRGWPWRWRRPAAAPP